MQTSGNEALLARIGIIAAFVFLLVLFAFCFMQRRHLNNNVLLACTLLICTAVPFLLPHMHDRYFFLGDVFSVALAFVVPSLLHVPVCCSFASLLGYHAYLRMRYLLPMRYGACALLIVIITLLIALPAFFKPAHKARS